jgi:hypothetical protein
MNIPLKHWFPAQRSSRIDEAVSDPGIDQACRVVRKSLSPLLTCHPHISCGGCNDLRTFNNTWMNLTDSKQ